MKHPVDALKEFIPMTEEQETQLRKICDAEVCSGCGREVLKWTSDLPTQEGWYWVKRFLFPENLIIMYVDERGPSEVIASNQRVEWYGPIEPPEYTEKENRNGL